MIHTNTCSRQRLSISSNQGSQVMQVEAASTSIPLVECVSNHHSQTLSYIEGQHIHQPWCVCQQSQELYKLQPIVNIHSADDTSCHQLRTEPVPHTVLHIVLHRSTFRTGSSSDIWYCLQPVYFDSTQHMHVTGCRYLSFAHTAKQ